MKSKNGIILLLIILLISVSSICTAKTDDSPAFFHLWKSKEMQSTKFDDKYKPSQYEVNAIYFVLKNTSEVNIHQMRGESKNQVFINKNKKNGGYAEAVYDEKGKIVTKGYNKGSFNYYLYDNDPLKHFSADILPWLVYGNAKDDPTSFNERLYYYLQDLDRGLQSYIFKGKINTLEKIDFKKLDKDEQMVVRFFAHLLFNKGYKIRLNEKNRNRLIKDSEFYWSYFYQMHSLLGYERK